MTQDVIIRMALEAGFRTRTIRSYTGDTMQFVVPLSGTNCIVELERFAALAVAHEREECALEAERQAEDEPYGHAKFRCVNIASAIRARGQA